MNMKTDDLRIDEIHEVIEPAKLISELALSENATRTVLSARKAIQDIMRGDDDRLLMITGPCSIHDVDAALEYADRLKELVEKTKDDLFIVMRVYFEKPRTTVGWKGLINDPNLDDSFEINKGLRVARKLLLDLAEKGVPTGTEFLDPISPQYVTDLISWGAIGARTTESQVHRELASGLSCPIGFKNATDGGLQIAVDAILSSSHPHHFLGTTKEGRSAIIATNGNPDCHVILRGGSDKPNYDTASIDQVSKLLDKAGLSNRLIVDCSHANSYKDHEKQVDVGKEVADQIANGEDRIFGIMLESNLIGGRQNLVDGKAETYGQSVTDACMGWEETEDVVQSFADAVRKNNNNS
ncbi:MAG: 3-deoxy-7-phosphoheptulonate synthase [Gammaproteobacteria bacterium]